MVTANFVGTEVDARDFGITQTNFEEFKGILKTFFGETCEGSVIKRLGTGGYEGKSIYSSINYFLKEDFQSEKYDFLVQKKREDTTGEISYRLLLADKKTGEISYVLEVKGNESDYAKAVNVYSSKDIKDTKTLNIEALDKAYTSLRVKFNKGETKKDFPKLQMPSVGILRSFGFLPDPNSSVESAENFQVEKITIDNDLIFKITPEQKTPMQFEIIVKEGEIILKDQRVLSELDISDPKVTGPCNDLPQADSSKVVSLRADLVRKADALGFKKSVDETIMTGGKGIKLDPNDPDCEDTRYGDCSPATSLANIWEEFKDFDYAPDNYIGGGQYVKEYGLGAEAVWKIKAATYLMAFERELSVEKSPKFFEALRASFHDGDFISSEPLIQYMKEDPHPGNPQLNELRKQQARWLEGITEADLRAGFTMEQLIQMQMERMQQHVVGPI